MDLSNECIVGIDFGLKRIGLAISNKGVSFAIPSKTIEAGKSDLDSVKAIIESFKEPIDRFVLGHPLYLDGKPSAMTHRVELFKQVLEQYTGKPVHYIDERLTSEQSEDLLKELGFNRKDRIPHKDSLSAQLILKDFLSYF